MSSIQQQDMQKSQKSQNQQQEQENQDPKNQEQTDQIINESNKQLDQEEIQNKSQDNIEQKQENLENEQQNIQQQQKQEDEPEIELSPRFYIREATHQGSWYTQSQHELDVQLNAWVDLAKCEIQNVEKIKAMIVPHSGFSLSGPTAAWPYKYLKVHQQANQPKLKVFLLGPAHYCFLRTACLSSMKIYKTPYGDIEIDQEVIKKLHNSGVSFEETDKDADEEEYSLEMQLPFLVKILGLQNFTLIPILVGSLDEKQEDQYSKVLLPYFEDENSLFIASSDFCHWGQKYKYTQTEVFDQSGEIFEGIEKLDQKAMELMELHDVDGLNQYFKETQNPICGKHAISILLRLFLNSSGQEIETKFIKYSMSHLVKDKNENSISFASAISYIEKNNK